MSERHDPRLVERVRMLAEGLSIDPPEIDSVIRRGARRQLVARAGVVVAALVIGAALVIPFRSLPHLGQDRGASAVLAPAPRDCPLPLLRSPTISVEEFRRLMGTYLPRWLPDGFGLLRALGPEQDVIDGPDVTGIWADTRCREVWLTFSSAFRGASPDVRYDASLPQVGPWTLRTDEPGECGNAVLGVGRCLDYAAVTQDGVLSLSMIGVKRDDGDRIALSILSEDSERPPPLTGTIAYIEGRQAFGPITLLDAASGRAESLGSRSYSSVSASWSPDGSMIALTRNILEGNGELIIVSATTGEITRTMPIDPLLNPQGVDWSPDGGSLAFSSTYSELWIIDSDGADLHRLQISVRALNLAWSPSRNELALVTNGGDLVIADLDGGEVRIAYDGGGGRALSTPSWSPDGERIAFSAEVDGPGQIFVIDRDGSDPVQLTSGTDDNDDPTWSPDGGWIAFSRGGDHTDLFAVTPDGSWLLQLTDTDRDEYGPDWR